MSDPLLQLEQEALHEVADAVNQDLLEHGHIENLSESPIALLETATEAETETEVEVEAENPADIKAFDHHDEYYEHYMDDEQAEERAAYRNATGIVQTAINNTVKASAAPTASAVPNRKADIRMRKLKSKNSTNSVWKNRRRYSYTDADYDGVDKLDAEGKKSDSDPEEDLKRLLADPDLEIYESDEDKGIYFGPSKKDARARRIRLRKALKASLREARAQRKLAEAARLQAKLPVGSNATVNATAAATAAAAATPAKPAFIEAEAETETEAETEVDAETDAEEIEA